MREFFSSWAVSVTVAILFSAMVSALLPETNIKKYIKVVLGIVVTMIILSPLFTLFGGNDIEQEINDALDSVNDTSNAQHDGLTYTDYILDVYEVYIGDE